MPKSKAKTVGILGVKKRKRWQMRPFGRFSEAYSSDDESDEDYVPDDYDDDYAQKKPNGERWRRDQELSKKTEQGESSKLESDAGRPRNQKQCKDVNWSLMPTEILVKVFSHVLMASNLASVIRCGKVCKQWNYASSHPSLWSKIDLSFMAESKKANDRSLSTVVNKKGFDALELYLTGWSKLTDKGIMAVAEKCQNLQSIGLSKCVGHTGTRKIKIPSILKLIENCYLKKVDFSWLPTDAFASKITRALCDKRGAQLESLNLCGCSIRFSILQYIQASSPNLRVLDLSNTFVDQLNIEKLQSGCPVLEELYMANALFDYSNVNAKEQELSPGFPKLTALSINCLNTTDKILSRILKNACSMKLLDLRKCAVTEQGLESLSSNSVEQLFLSRCSHSFSSLEPILRKDGKLQRIAQSDVKMKKLTILDLSGSPISDEGLRFLLCICPSLEDLNLTSCKGISRGLKHKHDRESLDNLRTKICTS